MKMGMLLLRARARGRVYEGRLVRSENALPKDALLQPVPGHVLGAAAADQAYL
jgi:hypothetical protein